jgi:hypothetical protein
MCLYGRLKALFLTHHNHPSFPLPLLLLSPCNSVLYPTKNISFIKGLTLGLREMKYCFIIIIIYIKYFLRVSILFSKFRVIDNSSVRVSVTLCIVGVHVCIHDMGICH